MLNRLKHKVTSGTAHRLE